MPETTTFEPAAPTRESVSLDERIGLEVGILVDRVLRTLVAAGAVRDEVSGGVDFLRSLAAPPPSDRPAWARGETVLERRPPGPPHPLDRLVDRFELDPLDADLVTLAGLAEEHEGLASVLSTVHPAGEPYATAGLAALVLVRSRDERHPLRRALVNGNARRHGVLAVRGDGPFFNRTLRVGAALWPVLHGVDALPDLLRPAGVPERDDGLDEWLARPDARRAVAAIRAGRRCLIHVAAERRDAGLHRGAALVRLAGGRPFAVRLARGGKGGGDPAPRLAVLHAALRGAVPVVAPPEPERPGGRSAEGFGDSPGPVIVCAPHGELRPPSGRPVLEVACESLPASARARLWSAALPELADSAHALAASYTAEAPTVLAAARDARCRAELDGRAVERADVVESVRARATAHGVEGVAVRRPHAGWDDLVLPDDRLAQLREALARVRHQHTVLDDWGFLRGRPGARGVRMLLSGPPGTGKTLSAEVLAGELGVDLLIADVSRLVSKWIGETEKNLARVFDAAEHAQAVLLFDEADALFARRTEVTDSTSRYANLETAYLLTRLERYEGLAVLSTNLRRNVDQAFLRRLEFVVEYSEPGTAERRALWRCHLPSGAPLAEEVALDEVASLYPMVGGHIRNAAVAAAFLAAQEDTPITRSCLIRAIRREHAKAGRAFPGPPSDMA